MEKLYYIDTDHTVREVPKTPEREASTTQIFYKTRREALEWLRWHLQGKAVTILERVKEIEAELSR